VGHASAGEFSLPYALSRARFGSAIDATNWKLQHHEWKTGPVLRVQSSAVVGTEHGVPGCAEKSSPQCWWVCGVKPSLLHCWETSQGVGMGRDLGGQGVPGLVWARNVAINVPLFDKRVFGRTGNKCVRGPSPLPVQGVSSWETTQRKILIFCLQLSARATAG